MHDKLFANQKSLQVADLKRHAAELGLDSDAFAQCLDAGKYTAEWQKDVAEAARYGIQGTPTFLVNGRLLPGAGTFEQFSQVIDEELERGRGRTGPRDSTAPVSQPRAGRPN